MAISFTSKTSKIIYIIAAVLTLLLLGLKYFDGDPTNDPKVQEVVDAGKNVYQGAVGDVVTATTSTVTTSTTE